MRNAPVPRTVRLVLCALIVASCVPTWTVYIGTSGAGAGHATGGASSGGSPGAGGAGAGHATGGGSAGAGGEACALASAPPTPPQISYRAPAAGNPSAYIRSDGVNAIPHIDLDAGDAGVPVLELTRGASVWTWDDLSAASSSPPGVGNPAAYVRNDDLDAVVYWGSTDGNLHEIRHQTNGWREGNLTVDSSAPPCAHPSDPAAYIRSDYANAVVYCCMDTGTVVEIHLPLGGAWQYEELNVNGAPSCQGDVVAYQRSDGANSVLYVATSANELWQLFSRDPASGWSADDLTGDPDAGETLEPVFGPSGWVQAHVRNDGTSSVVYVGEDRNVYELSLTIHGIFWGHQNLGQRAHDTSLAATRVFGFNRSDGVTSYVFWDTQQRLQEITLAPDGETWGFHIIPTGGVSYAGNAHTAYVRSDSVNAVAFFGTGGQSASGQDVFEASQAPCATTWTLTDLTTQAQETIY